MGNNLFMDRYIRNFEEHKGYSEDYQEKQLFSCPSLLELGRSNIESGNLLNLCIWKTTLCGMGILVRWLPTLINSDA
jgi:hypothetical protein